MTAPWRRLLGALLLLGVALVWQPDNSLIMTLGTLVAFVLAAYWLTGALFAVVLTVGLIAWCHLLLLELSETSQWLYLVTAIVCTCATFYIFLQRFRARIVETREARWQHRRQATEEEQD